MSAKADNPGPRASGFPLRRVLQIGAAGLVVAVVIVLVSGSHRTRTVSQVIEEIHGIALARPEGGLVGRWWVSATGLDPRTGRLEGFKLECGPIQFAARTARVLVNPSEDTFGFEMWNVVLARLPHQAGQETDDALEQLDRYLLDGLPYSMDIVPDRGTVIADMPPADLSVTTASGE